MLHYCNIDLNDSSKIFCAIIIEKKILPINILRKIEKEVLNMANGAAVATGVKKPSYFNKLFKDIVKQRWLYVLMIPGIAYFIIFRYVPIYGLQIAFQDFNPFNPAASEWVGFAQFERLFRSQHFPVVLRNTITISLLRLTFGFPVPIILALLMNEFHSTLYKRAVQTVIYLPHFISWVIMAGIITAFLHPSTGIINDVVYFFTGERIHFLISTQHFVPMLIATDIYKNMGWGTIIYFAAISSVDAEQYEAAIIDGAGRFKQAIHITIPSIRPTIIIVFILNLGSILHAGFEQIFMLYSPLVYQVSDIIDTFVFREGIVNASFSFSAAAGMFQSVVALILIAGSNYLVRFLGGRAIW